MKKEKFQIEDLIAILSKSNLTELVYEENENLKIKIKKSLLPKEQIRTMQPKMIILEKNENKAEVVISNEIGKYFYKDFIKIGETIKVGQSLGNIYTMGVKTTIKSKVSGKITEIMIEDGGVVDYGKELLKIETTNI